MKTKMMLYGLESSIDNPLDIILGDDIKRVLGIGVDTYTVYNTEAHDVLDRAGLGGSRNNNTIASEYIHIESTEEPEEDSGTMMHPERYTDFNIFWDNEIGVRIGTLRYKRKKTINFTYYSQSKATITAMIEKIRAFDIMNTARKKHKLEYHFDVPVDALHFINHVRELKNKRLENEEQLDLPDYINKWSIQKISRNNTTSNTPYKFNLSIRENVYDVYSIPATDTYNIEKEEVGEVSYWKFTLTFDVWYQKPTMLILDYPVLIWNTPIGAKYSKVAARPEVRCPVQGTPDLMYRGLYYIGKPNAGYKGFGYQQKLVIPLVDDFDNFPYNNRFANVCSMLIVVDDKDPYEVANIKHLPHYGIKEGFLKYLLLEPSEVTVEYKNLFNIQLYKNGVLDYKNKISLDKEGNLTTEFPMDIKSTYRIIIRVLRDLDYLDEKSLKRLHKYVQTEMLCINKERKEKLAEMEKKKLLDKPHRKLELYYVDEFGNILDPEGYVCYTDGTRVTVKATDK